MVANGGCGWCQGDATLACGGCGKTYYCSREHQRQHWVTHKADCRSYVELQSPTEGRYLVASKDLKAGTLIIKEGPIALGPTATSPLVCLGCHSLVVGKRFCKCPGCAWPLCSRDCKSSGLHSPEECQILSQDKKKCGVPIRQGETPRYDLILILRCLLLRESNPTYWKRINSMISHGEIRKEDAEPHHTAAIKYYTDVCKVQFELDVLHHVRGAIITNAINTRSHTGAELRGLYPIVSRLNHGCHPNVTLRSDSQGTLFVRAAVDIPKNTPLSFSYIKPTDPIWQRQSELLNIYYFNCMCSRCKDPTELGTYLSSPLCSKCTKGYIIPSDGWLSKWTCSSCSQKRESSEICKMFDLGKYSIEKRTKTPEAAQVLIKEVAADFHNSHYVWISVAHAILRTLRKDNTLTSLRLRRDLWKNILTIYKTIEPGLTRRRGISLLQYASVRAAAAQKEYTSSFITLEALRNHLQDTLVDLEEAQTILELEPPSSTEEHWLLETREEVEQIKQVLENFPQVQF